MKRGEEKEVLSWFLAEVRKDVAGPAETERSGGRSASSSAEGASEERAYAQAALATLKAHENCRYAAYLPSNSSFAVQQRNKIQRRFSVECLQKKRKVALEALESDLGGEDRWAEVRAAFEACTHKGLVFLDEGREDAPALADAPEGAPALLDE